MEDLPQHFLRTPEQQVQASSAAQGRPKKRGHVVLEAFVDASAEHDLGRYLEDVRRAFANDFSCYVHELYPDARVHARVTVEGE